MPTSQQKFHIIRAQATDAGDHEIEALLTTVYVDGGYTPKDRAKTMFAAEQVRQRGELWVARSLSDGVLVGMVIFVSAQSKAKKLAEADEGEIQLLAVLPEYRGQGLGYQLLEQAMDFARQSGCKKLLLWTQDSMESAKRLYRKVGFCPRNQFTQQGKVFSVFEKQIEH